MPKHKVVGRKGELGRGKGAKEDCKKERNEEKEKENWRRREEGRILAKERKYSTKRMREKRWISRDLRLTENYGANAEGLYQCKLLLITL